MTDDGTKTLAKVRTFAKDVERARLKSGEAALPEDQVTPEKNAPVKKREEAATVKAAEPTPSAPIPAFHELKKKPVIKEAPLVVDTKTVASVETKATGTPAPKKIQVRVKKRPSAEKKSTGSATIITDTKKGDFEFLPAVLASIDRSVDKLRKHFKKKAKPTYSITATDRRKGVIQKATSKTGTIFTADSETLKEEILRRQARTAHRVDPEDGTHEILWSPNTEPGYALLEGEPAAVVHAPQKVTVEFKQKSVPLPPVEPAPQPTPAPVPAPVAVPEPIIVPTPPAPEPAPQPEPVVVPAPAVPVREEEEVPPSTADITEEEYTEPDTTPEKAASSPVVHWTEIRNIGDVSKVRTNTLALGIVSVIFTFTVVVVGVRILLNILIPAPADMITLTEAVPLSAIPTVVDVPLTTLTPEALLATVRNPEEEILPTEVRFVHDKGDVIPARDILALMTVRVDPNFTQSVTDVRVAHLETGRALVLTVTDSATAFGSLLQWETTMSEDLADVLGLTYISSTEKFVDVTYQGIDLRILRNNDEPVLLYAFIDEHTIVIAPDLNALATLLGSND